MHDKNAEICKVCDNTLDIVAVSVDLWIMDVLLVGLILTVQCKDPFSM